MDSGGTTHPYLFHGTGGSHLGGVSVKAGRSSDGRDARNGDLKRAEGRGAHRLPWRQSCMVAAAGVAVAVVLMDAGGVGGEPRSNHRSRLPHLATPRPRRRWAELEWGRKRCHGRRAGRPKGGEGLGAEEHGDGGCPLQVHRFTAAAPWGGPQVGVGLKRTGVQRAARRRSLAQRPEGGGATVGAVGQKEGVQKNAHARGDAGAGAQARCRRGHSRAAPRTRRWPRAHGWAGRRERGRAELTPRTTHHRPRCGYFR